MSRFRNTFFTSDMHIGHANSIKFDKRPFTDLEHMHRVLVNNYNASVKSGDICYFLGDIGVANTYITEQIIKQLNGTKILIIGNHDKGYNAMLNAGFDAVMNSATLVIANEIVTLSHCPLYGVYREDTAGMRGGVLGENWHGETRYRFKEFTVPDYGQFHLHGHIHSPNGGKSEKILGKQYDVGIVANNYRPVSISMIESWIALYKRGENVR
jgi:calcineurin-like phosphoesterase family protein